MKFRNVLIILVLLFVTVTVQAATLVERIDIGRIVRETRARIVRVIRTKPAAPATTGDNLQPPLPAPCPAGQTCP